MYDFIDYKLDINVWTTATIIGYVDNNENRLKIKFNGWNLDDFKDEIVIDRNDKNLLKYKTKTNVINHNNDNIVKEGSMSKEGEWKRWKKRYFMLDFQGNIRYYNQQGDKEWVNTFNIKSSKTKIDKSKKYLYVTTDIKTWKFQCASDKDLIKWINAINFAKQFEII
eukprot:352937_1